LIFAIRAASYTAITADCRPTAAALRSAEPTEEVPLSEREKPHESRSAEAAALRWSEKHPDEGVEYPVHSDVPEDSDIVPNRHSASAEAASLRWHEQHDEDDDA
jgi:hypothetical protein